MKTLKVAVMDVTRIIVFKLLKVSLCYRCYIQYYTLNFLILSADSHTRHTIMYKVHHYTYELTCVIFHQCTEYSMRYTVLIDKGEYILKEAAMTGHRRAEWFY